MGDTKRPRTEKDYAFNGVMFMGKKFNLIGKETADGIEVTSGQNRIVMDVYLGNRRQAHIQSFFFPEGDRDADFQLLRGPLRGPSVAEVQRLAHDTMTILCLIALYCECSLVYLEDDAKKGPFKLSNSRFMGPAYLDYYGKHYGFIKEKEISKDLGVAVVDGFQMRNNNRDLATTKLLVPIKLETPEEIVRNYFNFSKQDRAIPLIKWRLNMDDAVETRYRHMDPVKKQWIVFDEQEDKFKADDVKFNFGIIENKFIIG